MYKGHNELILRELEKNQNHEEEKKQIKGLVRTIEEKVYWLNTQTQATFIQQFWDKKISQNQILKERVAKIIQQKFQQFASQLETKKDGQLHVMAEQRNQVESMITNIPHLDPNYFSPTHPKTKQIKMKLKQIKNDVKEHKQKTQRIKRQKIEKKQQKINEQEQIQKDQEEKKRQKYHQQVQKAIQMNKIHQHQRKEQHQKFKEFLKVYKNTKPLHVLMEEQYHQKIQLPILQEKKLKKIQDQKHRQKPSLQQINEHEKHYLQMRENRQSRIYVANQTIDVPFKSRYYLEEQKKLLENNEGETILDQVEKKKRYSQIVKQKFRPKTILKKTQEEEKPIYKEVPTLKEINEKGQIYMEYMRSLKKKKRQNSSPSEEKNTSNEKSHYINYLENFKASRPKRSGLSHDWTRQLKNNKTTNPYQKRQKVLLASKKLQEKAFRQEQFVTYQAYGNAEDYISKKNEIDQNIVEAIKAKIAVLKDSQGN